MRARGQKTGEGLLREAQAGAASAVCKRRHLGTPTQATDIRGICCSHKRPGEKCGLGPPLPSEPLSVAPVGVRAGHAVGGRDGNLLPGALGARRPVRRRAPAAGGDRSQPARCLRPRPTGGRPVRPLHRTPRARRPGAVVPAEGLLRQRTDRHGAADQCRRRAGGADARPVAGRRGRDVRGSRPGRTPRPDAGARGDARSRPAAHRRRAGAGAGCSR